MMDPTVIMECHRKNLLEEADHERLIAQLPPRGFAARRLLATACMRVADWLDGPVTVNGFNAARDLGLGARNRLHSARRFGHPTSRSSLFSTDGAFLIAVAQRPKPKSVVTPAQDV